MVAIDPKRAFNDLLRRPLRGGTRRQRHVQNLSVDVPDDKKDVHRLELDGSNAEEVAHIVDSCRLRNSRHPGDGPRLWGRLMYLLSPSVAAA